MTPANDAQPHNERRLSPRRRGLRAGRLTTADAMRSSDCIIRNLSTRGAKLTLPGEEGFPQDAWLIVKTEGLALRTRTVWRHGCEFGVDFVEAHDLDRAPPPQLMGLRRLWVDQLPR